MNPLSQVQKQLIESNGMVRKPLLPFERLSTDQKQDYLKKKFNLTHGKGKKKRKKK